MKSHAFLNTEDVSETNRQRFHLPLHQIMAKYCTDTLTIVAIPPICCSNGQKTEHPYSAWNACCIKTAFISTTWHTYDE